MIEGSPHHSDEIISSLLGIMDVGTVQHNTCEFELLLFLPEGDLGKFQ